MPDFFSKLLKDPRAHIVLPVAAAILMNGFIYSSRFFGQYEKQKDVAGLPKGLPEGLPKGYVIGFVWLIIFAFLGYAHYLLYSLQKGLSRGCIALEVLFVYSLLYPVITGLQIQSGLVFNLLALVLGFITGGFVLHESVDALYYVAPYLLWAAYVNYVFVVLCSGKKG